MRAARSVTSSQSCSRPIRASAASVSRSGIALGRERGEDLLEPSRRGPRRGRPGERTRPPAPGQPGVAFEHLAPDLFRVAVGRQVGAGEEHLAAAGRDRHEAVEGDRVADRPGRDHDARRRGEQHRRLAQRPAATPAPSPRAKTTSASRTGDGEVLGADQRQRAEQQRPGSSPAPPAAVAGRPAQSIASTAPGQQRRRQRLASSASPGTRAAPGRSPPRAAPISPADRPRRAGGRSG